MAFDFEQLHSILFGRLTSAVGSELKLTTRQELTFADVPIERQPAMIVLAGPATARRGQHEPTIWTVHAHVLLYVRQPTDRKLTAETTLFRILGLIDGALALQPGEFNSTDLGTNLGLASVDRVQRTEHLPFDGMNTGQAAFGLTIEIEAHEVS